jgi:diacylglycerol kinase family enzyme
MVRDAEPARHDDERPDETGSAAGRRIAVIFNPRSGYWISRPAAERDALWRRLAETHGVSTEAHALPRGDFARGIERAIASRPDALFVAGGDGTINAVVRALRGRRMPIGIVPTGTLNLLARDLGIPLEPEVAVAALLRGVEHDIDVAYVNDCPFLCNSQLGLVPHVAHARERARGKGHGRWRLTPRVWRRALWLWRSYPRVGVELDVGGHAVRLRTRAITVSNNPIAPGAGSPVPGRASIDRGLLGVYALREGSRYALLRLMAKLLAGTWREDPDVVEHETPRLTIDLGQRRRVSLSNDGEVVRMHTPLRYRIEPRALRVIVPRPKPPP